MELKKTNEQIKQNKNKLTGDFPGGPAVENLPSNAGDMGLIPVRELRSHMLRGN